MGWISGSSSSLSHALTNLMLEQSAATLCFLSAGCSGFTAFGGGLFRDMCVCVREYASSVLFKCWVGHRHQKNIIIPAMDTPGIEPGTARKQYEC
ncbi:hypothetical protein P691DRAFT_807660 [Macrolepiota fuliginosa MF-IS2]|uniref:Uncharacterized protein n=1 Tax=Macrolepiota fuliginosa MF-IS2 TaxID=1400762 RepID=A0A9P6C494_9AGAR|nr:hypothetical protein P691DRAFT_807660 [Macrolepiota fuliginosa MF-IS2]